MILNPKMTHIAFRCPKCGSITRGVAGSFSLASSGMLRLRCSCGRGGEMTMTGTSDDRVRITVPCLLCDKDHQFSVSQSLFFEKDLFLFHCPFTNIPIAFFGQHEEKLIRATEESTEELERIFNEFSIRFPGEEEDGEEEEIVTPDFLPDAQIHDIIRFMVKELEADGAIRCPCHGGVYEVEMTEEGVRVFCPSCGASRLFKTNSVAAAQEFLSCDSLELT